MKKIITLLLLNLVFCLQAQEIKEGILHLKIEPTNTVYVLGQPILVKATFKNISNDIIQFFTRFKDDTSESFFRLERIKLPTDKGDEISLEPIMYSSVSLSEEPDAYTTLKPQEECSAIVNIQDLVEKLKLKLGTHQLVLIYRHVIFMLDNGSFRYIENEKGRVFKRWPSEPFTLTLEAPKSPTTESSK